MSYADQVFISVCRDILAEGFWDTDLPVRPRWTDGTPAHTVKKFGVVNRYDLREEFPIMTLRPTAFRSCVDELLWIWQKRLVTIRRLAGFSRRSLSTRSTWSNQPSPYWWRTPSW